jgi:hypothetical protein
LKKHIIILIILLSFEFGANAQKQTTPDFTWGNASYFNLDVGESIFFNDTEIKLIWIENHFNQLQIGDEAFTIKVSRRTLPIVAGKLRVFVADNKNVKAISANKETHGLLKKDALICISDFQLPLLDPNNYLFPVSFGDGFLWSVEEDSHMFSYFGKAEGKSKEATNHDGIDFDLHEARGIEKHWIVAIENSTVVWIEEKNLDKAGKEACVLIESDSQPGIYYLYKHLNNKKIEVKTGQRLQRGELIGAIWGDEIWGHLTLSVIKSDTIPSFQDCSNNVVNCFPQIFELYFKQSDGFSKNFSKGRIFFGKNRSLNGNQKNAIEFEEYSGKGWILGKWNVTDRVDWVAKGNEGNIRLGKKLFEGSAAECTNPNDWYDYEINVQNGVYRIRAKMGDSALPTWQKISFEGIEAGVLSNETGEFKWTSEKAVKVIDGKLTIRIFIDSNNKKPAGISEIVFQKSY